ncbi:ImmA/IrrE family metallo-endopeptidase [Arthrobacter luteolus]|uniref:ImmA/IrrE family metallo-endopeptidase n=1 Tax=Arthrobacter luteolus TaxID=98672 RepID=UPI00082C578D|nr:ImmA/IrrE family metallo-endopeptidase [Arthrobacter luteolus]
MSRTLTTNSHPALRQSAEDLAEAVLEEYWSDDDLPIDPVVIARRLGAEVFNAQLGNDVIGMIMGDPSGASIYLDEDQPRNRYRFTCAHEIGHYVERSGSLDAPSNYVDRRSDESVAPWEKPEDEIFADHFAGALLMPRQKLVSMMEKGMSDLAMANEFGVALGSLRYRKSFFPA